MSAKSWERAGASSSLERRKEVADLIRNIADRLEDGVAEVMWRQDEHPDGSAFTNVMASHKMPSPTPNPTACGESE